MTTILFGVAAFALAFLAGHRSLRHGIAAVLAVGYVYGILRANFPDTWTYLTFDLAVVGLYAAQLWRSIPFPDRVRTQNLRLWITLLIAWPLLLFSLLPVDDLFVELVGLRANAFLLPFAILGSRLRREDIYELALIVSVLNLAVVSIGLVQFVVGIQPFFPANEVTEIIYRSRDVAGFTAHRIPATFSSAHAFGGTMVMTLPVLVGAWVQPQQKRWHVMLLGTAIVASLVGVFMAAARTHMITAAALIVLVTATGGLRGSQKLRWAMAVAVVAYIVAGEARLQRFTTLKDLDYLSHRWTGSVNSGVVDLILEHPLGNGLAGGGSSVPHFLRSHRQLDPIIESEYGRLGLEQGIPGLALWVCFSLWTITRWPRRSRDPWLLGLRMAWLACGSIFVAGLIGMGMLTSVPQTVVMLILLGWFTTSRSRVPVPVLASPSWPTPATTPAAPADAPGARV